MLTSHGYRVRVASNGKRAIESVKLALPNMILLDIKMPGLTGYDVCEQLKANEQTRDIPIIFISALDNVQSKLRGFSIGGVDYITKPFQVEEVLARVETHLNLRKLQKELQDTNERMRRELHLAGHMQANFMPRNLPHLRDWQFAAALLPARETSGDFYDIFPLEDGKIGLLMADVVDKGVAAALFMVLSWSLLREGVNASPRFPEQVLANVNQKILDLFENLEYVTAFLGILDPASGELTYANAGQDPPMLISTNGKTRLLTRTGLALGVSDEQGWKQSVIQLHSGDLLILYTDGVTEACNLVMAPFGLGRIRSCAQKYLQRSAEEIKQEILNEVQNFLEGEHAQDDITLAIVKRN